MPDNPYMVVGGGNGPNYSAPLLDWQGMANGIGNALTGKQTQQKQPGQPMDIRPGAAGGTGPGAPSQAQQQMQGLGNRLAQMFGFGGQPQPQQPQGQGPPMPPPQNLPGLY